MNLRRSLPWALVWLRLSLAPVILVLAWLWPIPAAFGACIVLAFFSDVFDGVLARRWGGATPLLRRLDSLVDTAFCLAALGAAWLCQPRLLWNVRFLLAALLALEVLRYVVDLAKFGREASYHMWSAKLWAVLLYLAFFMVLVVGQGGAWVTTALFLGIVSDLEGLAVSWLLPEWRHDVPTLLHAWRLRQENAP
ncbi:MAG TPA: CDP-alcohol phosphatidyltransferase family protein [Gammaproteobacteria bacterium]|nr:CDP-alcohol phosphatidyltransferase family protein [Gammaproteobacteria bacterium]